MKDKDNQITKESEPLDVSEIEAAVEIAARLLDDEEFVKKYALGNPTVERVIIESYLRGMKKSAPTAPQGAASLAPKQRPKTLDEARKLCELYLSKL